MGVLEFCYGGPSLNEGMCYPIGVGPRLGSSVPNDIPEDFIVTRAALTIFTCLLMKPLELGYKFLQGFLMRRVVHCQ